MISNLCLPQKKPPAAEVVDPATPMYVLVLEEKIKMKKKVDLLCLICNTTALW